MKVRRLALLATIAVGSTLVVVPSSVAWKPSTHEQSAFAAYDDAVDDGRVSIGGIEVAADPELVAALRAHPEAYRAGVLGPDAYPDIYVGQAMVHPDTVTDNDRLPADPTRHSYTDDWLREVWRRSLEMPPGDERLRVRAFAVGFLTHAAGDVWGHTFVNEFAKGVFPSVTDLPEAPIAIRHVVVEGYVDSLRDVPDPDPADISNIDPPDEFVTRVLITSPFARSHSAPVHFDLFLDRRASLQADLDAAMSRLGSAGPSEAWFLPAWISHLGSQIREIDAGLEAWPEFSTRVAKAVLAPESDFAAAADAAIEFGFLNVAPMLGVPRPVGEWVVGVRRWLASLDAALRQLTQPIADWVDAIVDRAVDTLLRNYLDISELPPAMRAVIDADGDGALSLAELRGLGKVDVLVNTPAIVDPADKARLDALIGVGVDRSRFDEGSFAAYADTVTLSKLALLGRDGLNALASAAGVVGELYPAADEASGNVMLGWIRSIDGEYQWRDRSLRAGETRSFGFGTMRLWEDCQARDLLFRRVFTEPLPGAFADAGDTCSDLAAPPG